MKKIKLLTPILGLTAIVTPIVTTSCSGSGDTVSKDYKPSNIYTPTAEEKENGITAERALEIYCDALDSKPEIHGQEMKYHVSTVLAYYSKLYECKIEFSAKNIKCNKTNKTVSFDIELYQWTKEDGVVKVDAKMVATVTDMPLYMEYSACIPESSNYAWGWQHQYDQAKWSNSTKIVGKMTGKSDDGSAIEFTGTERTVDRNTDFKGEISTQEKIEQFSLYQVINGQYSLAGHCYYLKDLKQKA